jgi:hypothetical protein
LLSIALLTEIGSLPHSGGKNIVTSGDLDSKPSRALQRYYPWVVNGIAFLTVGVAFGTRNAFAVFLIAVIKEFK